jgi:biopolymer transport protein ExbD
MLILLTIFLSMGAPFNESLPFLRNRSKKEEKRFTKLLQRESKMMISIHNLQKCQVQLQPITAWELRSRLWFLRPSPTS